MAQRTNSADELIEVRRAAALVGRHPETIRRWVWSGRLAAHRRGNRLLVAQADVRAMAGQDAAASTLREWADRARAVRAAGRAGVTGRSAADLVVEDRMLRSGLPRSRARR